MFKNSYSDLQAFIAVARERSFTRAAAQLGVSQSALSRTIREMETKLGVRLLTRTTRSVSPTDAGERLLQNVAPRFQEIEAELAAVETMRDNPVGTLRITTPEYAAETILWPTLVKLLPEYPDIKVEVTVDPRISDIEPERFNFGIRVGNEPVENMTSVRIGPDIQVAIVGSPAYLGTRPEIKGPEDLTAHECINKILLSEGKPSAWELRNGNKHVNVFVEGRLSFTGAKPIVQAALAGFGLGYVPLEMAQPYITEGKLKQVMEDWCPVFTGYHLYFPSHRHPSRAMTVLIDALCYPSKGA